MFIERASASADAAAGRGRKERRTGAPADGAARRPGLAAALIVLLSLVPARAQIELAYEQGFVGLAHQLRRLDTTLRILHVGAHPDDEDSALLAYCARGLGARTAYLSLNRGEGGQNAVGSELFEPLGLLRTEELLAARRLDGAEQYFGAVMDFGFSKSADETLRFWGREAALGDVVAVIRATRPQIVISRFLGDPGDGHGHHQAAGLLCREAFRAAADPAAFPEQRQRGLLPWRAQRLYATRWNLENPPQRVDVGEFSPLYGRSYQSIALEGRSQHRSQSMGRTYPRGPASSPLLLLDTADGAKPDTPWLTGIDTTAPAAIPAPAQGQPLWQQAAREALIEGAAAVDRADAYLTPGPYPRRVVAELAAAVRAFRRAVTLLSANAVPLNEATATWRLVAQQKLDEAQRAIILAAGIELDGLADGPTAAPGEARTVTVQAFWPAVAEVEDPRLRLEAPPNWPVEVVVEPPSYGDGTPSAVAGFRVTVPADAAPTQPYWLRRPRHGFRFDVPADSPAGAPLEPPPLRASLRCRIAGEPVSWSVPVTFRSGEPRRGERRRPVEITPRLSAGVGPSPILIAPGERVRVALTVALTNHTSAAVQVQLGALCGDAPVPLEPSQASLQPGETRELPIAATLPPLAEPASIRLIVDGQPAWAVRRLDYEHITPRQYLEPAAARLVPVEAKVEGRPRTGTIAGPGDSLPEAIERLGVPVQRLDGAAVRAGAYDGLDLIVVGLRAYETNAALRAHNAALLEWVRRGGVLLVEYQQYEYQEGGFAPYPVQYNQPHDRVTDETAPVALLAPEHPLLSRPNRLGPADFEGWVQERGLYFWRTWDAAYTPLLACADPGDEPRRGGLLVANVGQGAYIYCAYALFRQLPEGVPGAYRLLANLVSYPATRRGSIP